MRTRELSTADPHNVDSYFGLLQFSPCSQVDTPTRCPVNHPGSLHDHLASALDSQRDRQRSLVTRDFFQTKFKKHVVERAPPPPQPQQEAQVGQTSGAQGQVGEDKEGPGKETGEKDGEEVAEGDGEAPKHSPCA